MDNMLSKLIDIMFSGFWSFCGVTIVLSGIANFIFVIWNRTLRHLNIRKHGYPPAHCDADGDFKVIIKEDKNEAV